MCCRSWQRWVGYNPTRLLSLYPIREFHPLRASHLRRGTVLYPRGKEREGESSTQHGGPKCLPLRLALVPLAFSSLRFFVTRPENPTSSCTLDSFCFVLFFIRSPLFSWSIFFSRFFSLRNDRLAPSFCLSIEPVSRTTIFKRSESPRRYLHRKREWRRVRFEEPDTDNLVLNTPYPRARPRAIYVLARPMIEHLRK